MDDDREPSDPTPQEIAECCRRIRSTWDELTHYQRRCGRRGVTREDCAAAMQWCPPVVETVELLQADTDS